MKKDSKIKLVFNGGNHILDSATVPIQWHFSKELIEENPKTLLIIDLPKEALEGHNRNNFRNKGERHLIEVKKRNDYIQFNSSGDHIIFVVPMSVSLSEDLQKRFLHKRDDVFSTDISIKDLLARDLSIERGPLAMQHFEVNIPEELFASRPKTALQKKIWKWVNLWFESEPKDQCHYRKRFMFAFTFQPILFLLKYLLLGVALVIYGLIHPLASIVLSTIWILLQVVVAFVGYPISPSDFFKDLKRLWTWPIFSLFERDWAWDIDNGESSFENIYRKCGDIKLWFAPWELFLLAFILYDIFTITSIDSILCLVGAIVIFTLLRIFLPLLSKDAEKEMKERRRKSKIEREIEEEREYLEWMRKYLDLQTTPDKITLQNMEASYDGKAWHKGKIMFWAAKAKVCKPYTKRY